MAVVEIEYQLGRWQVLRKNSAGLHNPVELPNGGATTKIEKR